MNKPRIRLNELYRIETNKSLYIAYNTETIEDDACNIEIVENRLGIIKIILEEKLVYDAFGGMGGDSFTRLVLNSKSYLEEYINSKNEEIIKIIK